MKFNVLLFLCLFCGCIEAQKNHFNLVFGFGPSYFFNTPGSQRRVDHSAAAGVNYVFHKRNKAIVFNPGLNYRINAYHTTMSLGRVVHVHQHIFSLALDMLMRVSKKNQLRAGLLLNAEFGQEIFINQKNAGGPIYSYGNSDIDRSYSPAPLQAGLTLGFRRSFQLFRREQGFNIQVVHMASPLVGSDYKLSQNLVGEDVTVLTVKARPTMLILSLEFNLQRKEKVKKEPEDEL